MSLVDGDLSQKQWQRLIDRIDGMATHGELSVVVEDALDVGADEASRRIDSAAENGLLDKRMSGLFEEYSVSDPTPEPDAEPEPAPEPTPEDDPEPEPEPAPTDDSASPEPDDETDDSTVDSLDDIGVGETISADDLDALTAGATTSAVDVVDPAAGPETGDEHVDATVHEPDAPDSDDDTSEPDITLADLDLAAPADDHAALPSTDDVRACMAAAIDWYHDQLSEMHRDMIEHKWGISRSQQDALKIGFCPSGNGLVEHLHGLGFDALTIVRAGLASAPVVKHAYADAPNYPKFERDYGTAFDATARAIQADVIDREQVDLARVTAHAGAEGELSLYDWWDNRIIFPYWDGDQPTYMIARATGQTEDFMLSNGDAQKYLKHPVDNPWVDGDAIHEPIFGKDTVRDGDRLIVTEGVTDAIMAHQHGFACVSPVTKTFKEKHHEPLLELATAASDVFLCLDNEESGEGLKGALKTGAFLEHEGVDARIATLPRPDDSEKVDLADYLKARAREDLLSVLAEAVATTEHPDYDPDEHGPQEADADSSTPDVDGANKSTSDETSALFDLDITDVTGMREGERGPNPVEHRGNSEDYFVITEAPGGDLGGYDHKAGHFFNALTLLLCEAGQRSVDDPTGSLSDEDIWAAWHQAKRDRHIAVDDRVPYRAILHLVRKHDLQPPETIPDSYGDDKSLLPTAYNRALRVIDQEYGLDPGREQRSDGEYIPSEAELGLDSKPETNAEARQQFFERATLKEKQSAE